MPTVGEPVGLLLALTYEEYVAPPIGDPEIGNPIGLLLALTYSDGSVAPEPTPTVIPEYAWGPSQEVVDRIYRALYGTPKSKKRKRAVRLEKVAIELMNEFDPGPDLPPIDLSSLRAAIALLDQPIRIDRAEPEVARRKTVEALFNKAAQLTQEAIEDDDEEVIEMALKALLN